MPPPSPLLAQAERCLREGRIEDGIAAYRAALAIDPAWPDAWYNLAYLERCGGRFSAALASYGEALARGADGVEAIHVNRAAILSEHLERSAEAEAELRLALAADPAFLPAWLNLGMLGEDRGDAAAARAAYHGALDVAPGNGRALARLAAIHVFEGEPAAARALAAQALAGGRGGTEDRAELTFALGAAHDALGDYAAAFAAFDDANRLARAAARPGTAYDPAASAALIDRIIAAFPQPAPPADDSDTTPALFICGMFRSGSTLTEQVLARHPGVTAGGELDYIPALADRCRPYPERAAAADGAAVAQWRADYRAALGTRFPAAGIVTDKRCDNFLHIGLIKRLFPDARIVHTVRQPLDTLLSIHSQYFDDAIGYSRSLDDAAHWYGQYRRLMRHWRALYPDDIHDLDYDALVATPEPVIAALLSFAGLAWDERCLSPQQAGGTVRTASLWQVRRALHRQSSGRWRNYAAQLADVAARFDLS